LLGEPETLLADRGYFSAANVAACQKAKIEPLIVSNRRLFWAVSGVVRLSPNVSNGHRLRKSEPGRGHGASG
jgi:hypothetical protein